MIDRNINNNQEPEIQKIDLETPGGLAFKKPKHSHKKRNIIIIVVNSLHNRKGSSFILII